MAENQNSKRGPITNPIIRTYAKKRNIYTLEMKFSEVVHVALQT